MKNITVIGSGTMGNGIAQVFALTKHQVHLVDVNTDILSKALETITKSLHRMEQKEKISLEEVQQTLDCITTTNVIEDAVVGADLVVEAVPEREGLKQTVFRQLDQIASEDCIFATNTSSISITKIANYTTRPDRVIGMHFMNPVPIMKLVEVIKGYQTSEDTANRIVKKSKELGKIPVAVNDYPGFISNRILMPMINEAICALHEGVAGVEEIDSIMMLGMAHPMGPLHLADFIGLDTCLSILRVLHDGFGNPKYAPNALLVNMVASGNLGIKTGEGFYRYGPGKKEKTVSAFLK